MLDNCSAPILEDADIRSPEIRYRTTADQSNRICTPRCYLSLSPIFESDNLDLVVKVRGKAKGPTALNSDALVTCLVSGVTINLMS